MKAKQTFIALQCIFFFTTLLPRLTPKIKEWTVIIYMAADNNLYYFARRNLDAMKNVGSNFNLNILVQLDHRGENTLPERLYIEKGKSNKCEYENDFLKEKLDFGQVETLVDCMRWATTYYPAKHYMLVLWNHGIGAVDSIVGKTVNSSELFIFNPSTALLELNRSVGFLEYFSEEKPYHRGICFSDTYATYITNQKLEESLKRISLEVLGGNKLDILAFDACLMSMIEIASLSAPYSDIMVGSQEVELGTGWPYERILKKLTYSFLSPVELGTHIVNSYHDYYQYITKDFTQSALNLNYIHELEQNITELTSLTLPFLLNPSYEILNRFIKGCKSKKICTYFSEPSYIDLHNFYSNMLHSISILKNDDSMPSHFINQFEIILTQGIELMKKIVIKNTVGKNLEKAFGISIYFPTYKIHTSYLHTPFGLKTQWLSFLQLLI